MTIHLAILAAALWGLSPRPVSGQPARETRAWRAVDSLTHGAFVRVTLADSEYVGRFTGRTAYDIILERYDRRLALPVSDIVRLWEANGRGTRDGFRVGAIIGGVAGAALGLVFGGFMCESDCAAEQANAVVLAGLGGAATLGLAGSAIGSLGFSWRQRFP